MQKAPRFVVGIDEVGRGPLAGPVTICAVMVPYKAYKRGVWSGLTDSKKMTKKSREHWYQKAKEMKEKGAITYVVASKTAREIDRQGIGACILRCVETALETLEADPSHTLVLLDGSLHAPNTYTFQKTIIKGDLTEKIISLASVIAKVTRDGYMVKMAKRYPGYMWERNMGYGTKEHQKALKKLGFTRLHRQSFCKYILDN